MQTTKIVAIAAVLAMVAAAGIGLGYAYQAQYTDYGTATSTVTGEFLTVQDSATAAANAISLDGTGPIELKVFMGTDITKTGASEYTRAWDITQAKVMNGTTDVTSKIFIEEQKTESVQTGIHLQGVFCLGVYDVTSPIATTDTSVVVTETCTTVLTIATGITEGSVVTNSIVLTKTDAAVPTGAAIPTEDKDIAVALTADTPTAVYVFVYLDAVIKVPNADNPAVVITVTPTVPVVTASQNTVPAA